jgi:hypothetical protein
MAVPSLKHDRNGIIHHSPRNIQPKNPVMEIRFAFSTAKRVKRWRENPCGTRIGCRKILGMPRHLRPAD